MSQDNKYKLAVLKELLKTHNNPEGVRARYRRLVMMLQLFFCFFIFLSALSTRYEAVHYLVPIFGHVAAGVCLGLSLSYKNAIKQLFMWDNFCSMNTELIEKEISDLEVEHNN